MSFLCQKSYTWRKLHAYLFCSRLTLFAQLTLWSLKDFLILSSNLVQERLFPSGRSVLFLALSTCTPVPFVVFGVPPHIFLATNPLVKLPPRNEIPAEEKQPQAGFFTIDQPLTMVIHHQLSSLKRNAVPWISNWGEKRQSNLHIFYKPLIQKDSCS